MFIALLLCLILAAILWPSATRGCLGTAFFLVVLFVAGYVLVAILAGGR